MTTSTRPRRSKRHPNLAEVLEHAGVTPEEMPRGQHRAPSEPGPITATNMARAAVVAAAGGAVTVVPIAEAHAAPVSAWDAVAACESGGNWAIDTGNGFFGGLQFTQSTWNAYKPAGAPARADLASKAQQIAAAEKTLAAQGWNAWPVCSTKAGVRQYLPGGSAPATPPLPSPRAIPQPRAGAIPAPRSATPPIPAPRPIPQPSTVTVRSGDWLTRIAPRVGEDWRQLYADNQRVVGPNPDRIFPGEVLTVARHSAPDQPATVPLPKVAPTQPMPKTPPVPHAVPAPAPRVTPVPAAASTATPNAVAIARQSIGKPYVWGAAGPAAFDCSGLVEFVYRQLGVNLPHSSLAQSSIGTRVASLAQAQPGDLLFFYSPVSHVGIYVGGGRMIAAPQQGESVKEQSVFATPTVIRRVL